MWKWFNSSKYIEEEYEQDKTRILELYKKKGFRNAKIVSDSIYDAGDDKVNIQLTIDEGKRFYHRDISIVGNSKYETDFLKNLLKIKKGDVYNTSLIEDRTMASKDNDDIRSWYLDNGYLFANVSVVESKVEGDSIDIEIRVHEGKPATIRKVIVKGNTRTKDHVILREIRTKPGQLFRKSDLQRTFREIAQMGFFDPESIGLDPIPDPVTNTVDIKYTLVEKSNSQVELQGGWGGNQFIGSVGLSFGNFAIQDAFDSGAWRPFPLGNGQKISLKTQMSYYFEHYSLSFSEPWWGGEKPTSLSVSLFHSQRSPYSRVKGGKDTSQKLYITGGSLGISTRLEWPDDYFILSQSVAYERYILDNYSSFYLFDFRNGFSNNLNYTIALGRSSSGPSPIYPREGSDFLLSGKFTLPYSYMFNNVYEDPGDDATDAQKEEYNQNRYKWLEYYKINIKGGLVYRNI